jgi:L-ornithine N5-monooxygenase
LRSESLSAPTGGVAAAGQDVYDLVGIGFGPSNIALAVAIREQGAPLSCLFLERRPRVEWHPGMLFDDARMQISFLKDLVTLRNPASPYSFLQYLKARGRLEHFVNLGEFRPLRVEYDDYLRWVAEDFADQVRYGTEVVRVTPVTEGVAADPVFSLFRIETEDLHSGTRSVVYARDVAHGGGGRPRMPANVPSAAGVLHSSEFLRRLPVEFKDQDAASVFVVVGGGQSAAETADYLLGHYPAATVHLVISTWSLKPADNSPYTNEQFYSASAARHFHLPAERRAAIGSQMRDANYSVVREDLIERLYRSDYQDQVKGRKRLHVHALSRLASVAERDGRLLASLQDQVDGRITEEIPCDGVVLATGYGRSLDPGVFGEVLPHLVVGEDGTPALTRGYRARSGPDLTCGLYLQGFGEDQFGLGDTLLSLLPFRAAEIVRDIRGSAPANTTALGCPAFSVQTAPRKPAAAYPPHWYLERDEEKLYALMERFKFATLVSASDSGQPFATQLPMLLDRSRGRHGVLFGHLDRSNPHAALLDGRRMLALFNGPSAYIPPAALEADPLPTWNSMSVHVRGRVRILEDEAAVVHALCGIAESSEPHSRLRPDDPRIARLIGGIRPFELHIDEMVGRFKLSQELDDTDRRNAALVLARQAESCERDFIERVIGLSLISADDPRQVIDSAIEPRPTSLGEIHE